MNSSAESSSKSAHAWGSASRGLHCVRCGGRGFHGCARREDPVTGVISVLRASDSKAEPGLSPASNPHGDAAGDVLGSRRGSGGVEQLLLVPIS